MKISHCGDIHVEEDRYFGDTAQCLEWFVEDSIHANTNLFVVDGDLTTTSKPSKSETSGSKRSFRWATTPRSSLWRATTARN